MNNFLVSLEMSDTFFEPLPILMDLLLTLGMMYLAQQILRKVSLQLSVR
ncbi:hypothetical protein [Ligilactobacillus murinus]|nr:hypothetical protein [Ligilactobacillus murinus]